MTKVFKNSNLFSSSLSPEEIGGGGGFFFWGSPSLELLANFFAHQFLRSCYSRYYKQQNITLVNNYVTIEKRRIELQQFLFRRRRFCRANFESFGDFAFKKGS